MKIKAFGKTHIGLVREKNEDCFLIAIDEDKYDIEGFGALMAVADGIGGCPLGDVASKMACDEILKYYSKKELRGASPTDLLKHLTNVVFNVHVALKKYSNDRMLPQHIGTTLSAMVFYKNKALVVHVGDSRIYRLRGGEFIRLTKDHTMAQQLYELGQIDEDDSYENPLSHILTQAVGIEISNPFVKEYDVFLKDIYLLCSDGLYNMVNSEAIKEVLETDLSLEDKCEELISLALKRGGKDNFTVVVVEVV